MKIDSFSSPPKPLERPDFKNLSKTSFVYRKSKSLVDDWREKFRNNCFERIISDRKKNVDKNRNYDFKNADYDPFAETYASNSKKYEIEEQDYCKIVKEEWLNFQKSNYAKSLALDEDPDFLANIEEEMRQEIENIQNNQIDAVPEEVIEDIALEEMAAEYEEYETEYLAYQLENLLKFN
ncbi:hypothetical protein AYI69_g3588 [Smittium culicis]|uniref:Uncharacterized protein n=1 Tax=Smittium culicis TaxID=133412 RepID=A0A1R1YJL6_9FUNG|nr:hypothetical protein AYI69_g3588 [Smittium culicis]